MKYHLVAQDLCISLKVVLLCLAKMVSTVIRRNNICDMQYNTIYSAHILKYSKTLLV